MKVGEAIDRIQSMYSRGAASSSSRLQSRYIYNAIKTARALIAEDVFWRSGGFEYSNICVDIEEVAPDKCGCRPSMGVTFWRSCKQIPTPLKRRDKYLVSASSVDGTMTISQTTWEAARHREGSRYKLNEFYIKDGYFWYISTGHRIKSFDLNGVWFDPVEAEAFNNVVVDANDVDIRTSPALWERIMEVVKNDLSFFIKMQEDGTTDGKDNPSK